MIDARIEDGVMLVETRYEHRGVAKNVPGNRWNGETKRWELPATGAAALRLEMNARKGPVPYEFDDEVSALLAGSHARAAVLNPDSQAAAVGAYPLPKSKTTARAHQKIGAALLEVSDAVFLIWDMGTGKTKPLVDYFATCDASTQHLVIAPLSVVPAWEDQFEVHAAFPVDFVCLDDRHASVAKKLDVITAALRRREYTQDPRPFVVVVNYDSARTFPLGPRYKSGAKRKTVVEPGFLLSQRWDTAVCDESQKIKDPRSLTSRFAAMLTTRARKRVALTGTPTPHSPIDLFGQFRFLDPSIVGLNFWSFRNRYAVLGGYQKKQVVGFRHEEELQALLFSVAHRVERHDVLDLPPTTDVIVPIVLPPDAVRLYREMEKEFYLRVDEGVIDVSNALVEGLRLQQLTSGFVSVDKGQDARGKTIRQLVDVHGAKAAWLREFLEDLPPGEPVVVFCRFTRDVERVLEVAEDCGRPPYELSGARKQLRDWQQNKSGFGGSVLSVQIKAGGVGVDMTRACHAVYWSLSDEWGDYFQSRARLDRHGQTRPVTYYHLVARGTVDKKRYDANRRKENMAEALLKRETKE